MRKRELDKFKKRLLEEKQAILQHLGQLQGESESQISMTGGDSADLAAVEITQAAISKLGNREKKLLKKIDHALNKFETGDFGVCERCGEGINPARLEARLVAQYCIDCKTELEQNERRYGDEEEDDEEWSGESDD
ncbi:MAG: TraR/DksA family transcriptional regulator [Bdellovibrionales bacterium]|nr:TraR/DksA family transcriptional regulator [Bdellovibrionales bacterium]